MKTSHKNMEVSRIEASLARMPVAAAMLAVAAALLLPRPARAVNFGVTGIGSSTYPTAKGMTSGGGASIDISQSEFGGASGKFVAASSQYLSTPDASDLHFGTGNFTIDFWVRFTSFPSGPTMLVTQLANANTFWGLYLNSGGTKQWVVTVDVGGTSFFAYTSNTSLSANTWYHVAFVRSGTASWNDVHFYQDGAVLPQSAIYGSPGADFNISTFLNIGRANNGTEYFNGWLDELRISKGVARWTSAFTPPTARYDRDSSTVLLLHNDGANLSTAFLDDVTTGQAKATKATLLANSTINSVSFYSYAAGNVRLAIYSDGGAPSGTRLWESGDVAVTASAWTTANVSSGTPTSLTLSAGTYWLAWQWNPQPNTTAPYAAGPSYTLGGSSSGNYLYDSPYAAFPTWSGGTATTENWSIYATALKTVPYQRNRNVALRILISDLLTATGETGLTFTGVNSPSAQGALVQDDGTYILYNPPGAGNVGDSFTYNISDGRVGTVIITMATEPSGQSGNIRDAGVDGFNHPTMTIFGVIGYQYEVQRATDVNGPWGDPGTPTTITIPGTGKYPYTNTSATVPPDGPFFYRTRPH